MSTAPWDVRLRRVAWQPVPSGLSVRMRVRLMMLISGLTTLIAIAAVIGVIGYRIYHSGGNAGGPVAESIVTLPKSARVISTAVAGDRTGDRPIAECEQRFRMAGASRKDSVCGA